MDVERVERVSVTHEALWTLNGISFWPNGTVPVCFQPRYDHSGVSELGTANYNLQTARIQSVIETFFEHRAGIAIDFTGWGTCPGPTVRHSRVGSPPTKGLVPANLGQTFAGGLKIMIQCDEEFESAWYGWANDGWGYPGATGQRIFWTAQSGYAWGLEWDSAVVHETLHSLGFAHEWDRSDYTEICDTNPKHPNGTYDPSTGTRWTKYDQASEMNETYCGDWTPRLSDMDMIGLAITYPDGSAIPVRGANDFETSAGLIVRRDDTLLTAWTKGGALDSAVFGTTPIWYQIVNGVATLLPAGNTQPVSNLSGSGGDIRGAFRDTANRSKILATTTVQVDDALHTALLMSTI
jgi:hypothetical protein